MAADWLQKLQKEMKLNAPGLDLQRKTMIMTILTESGATSSGMKSHNTDIECDE